MTEILTADDFKPHIGTGFSIHTNEHVEVLTLTEVDLGKASYPGARESFALLFNGSSTDLMFHSQLIQFTHPEMGELIFTISAFGRNEDGTYRYEAVFN